jgi:hypothetical protein
MLNYYGRLYSRALRETLERFGFERPGPFWTKLYVWIIVAAALFAFGFAGIAFGHLVLGFVLAAVVISIFPIIFAWKFLVAAFSIDQELRAELNELKSVKSSFNVSVMGELDTLLHEGNDLIDRHEQLSMGSPFKKWRNDLISWCARGETLIAEGLPQVEASGFSSISSLPNEKHTGKQLMKILESRHSKLRSIAMRYAQRES